MRISSISQLPKFILKDTVLVPTSRYYKQWVDLLSITFNFYSHHLSTDNFYVLISSWERSDGPHFQGRSLDISAIVLYGAVAYDTNNIPHDIQEPFKLNSFKSVLKDWPLLSMYFSDQFNKLINTDNISQIITPTSIFDTRLSSKKLIFYRDAPLWAKNLIRDHSNHIHITLRRKKF